MNAINKTPYLRISRGFPTDIDELSVELDKMYIETANAVNARTIGIFPTRNSAVTGESWYVNSNKRQQTLRQVYTFTTTGTYAHGINSQSFTQFTRCFGEYTDGTNYYGVIFGSNVSIAGQISFYLTFKNIVILSGAGAPSPTSITIVLEWLSDV